VSAQAIELELDQFLANDGYTVRFRMASAIGNDWFYTEVFHHGQLIAQKAVCRNHPRSARWALRQIRGHRKALRMLGGIAQGGPSG